MSKHQMTELIEELDDSAAVDSTESPKRTSHKRESKKRNADTRLFIRAQEISKEFKFTYKAARFEEAWLLDSLVEIAEHLWITDVLRKVKAGKEASVYLCSPGASAGKSLLAAKIYRPRMLRNLKNDAAYREGRGSIDIDANGHRVKGDRAHKAIKHRSAYGEEIRHLSWIAYEFQTLRTLYQAGADVPKPYVMEKNAIVMDFVGDENQAAPPLSAVKLNRDEAQTLFERVVQNIRIMLAHQLVHGDLSAYNILYWAGDISIIDFPQVVIPGSNQLAWDIFRRDVIRVCEYFSSQGVRTDGRKLAEELWEAHGHKIIQETDPQYLDAEKAEDRELWGGQK